MNTSESDGASISAGHPVMCGQSWSFLAFPGHYLFSEIVWPVTVTWIVVCTQTVRVNAPNHMKSYAHWSETERMQYLIAVQPPTQGCYHLTAAIVANRPMPIQDMSHFSVTRQPLAMFPCQWSQIVVSGIFFVRIRWFIEQNLIQ